jgi:hypothetical protein
MGQPYAWAPITKDWLTTFPTDAWTKGWMTARTWAGGARVDVPLRLVFDGYEVPLVIHRAVVTATIAPDGASATGRIGGVVSADELATNLSHVGGKLPCECPGLDGVLTQFRGAADMLVDGSQDPTKTCDGISIALEFEAVRAALAPPTVIPVPAGACICGP